MLKSIFSNPKRLFVCLFLISCYGLYSGFSLPVSMYPNTSKPAISMWVPYGTYSADTFRKEFGSIIEQRIKKASNEDVQVDEINANYNETGTYIEVDYAWGTSFNKAKKELELVAASMSSVLPREITDRIWVWQQDRNSGFFAASLYSPELTLQELYEAVSPILQPELDKILDAEQASVWNPERYIISVSLIPEKLAQYGIFPKTIRQQIRSSLMSYAGSSVKLGEGTQKFEINSEINRVEDLQSLTIQHEGRTLYLKELAEISFGRDLHRERSFKTNGMNSLIIFARPKSGANVKKMSEDIMKVLEEKKSALPSSLKTKLIVDPSDAIKNSIINLIKDVMVAASMAVLVLYLFIGGFKNVGSAAIEIPLSMLLSFIFMKMVGMNLNLISLGGLALAAGMNVDASVVILENIFKHKEIWINQGKALKSFKDRLELVYGAVKEVAIPVILSITTTLIVFIPMAFTSDLTNAILGDLARAVIFSHAISGVVALIIVPTVRVLLLKNSTTPTTALMDKPFEYFQNKYEKLLSKILDIPFNKLAFVCLPFITLAVLVTTLLPNLPKEVIGKPGSDWIFMSINAYSTQSSRHMENIMQEIETKALKELDDMVDYTWFEKRSRNRGQLMFKLFDRKNMEKAKKILNKNFTNTPDMSFWISDWNPAELPLPREQHFKAVITGGKQDIYNIGSRLKAYLKEKNYYNRVKRNPDSNQNFSFAFTPHPEIWKNLRSSRVFFNTADIAEISKLTKKPITVGKIDYNGFGTDIKVSMLDERYSDPEELKKYPLKIGEKVVPLSALGTFSSETRPGSVRVKDGQLISQVTGTLKEEDKRDWEKTLKKVEADVLANMDKIIGKAKGSIEFRYPQIELKNSLEQLTRSLVFSLVLIFFVLWMQFQSVKQVSVIMMTIPLGIIGVIISLAVFNSYLSLNSALGIILLNGITVNNSILLMEVTNKMRENGLRGKDLILTATKKRLRPIAITSLTTILGMLPVAMGLGDGGKILQPLGIAVTSGLFLATTITIFIVPALLYRKEENIADYINPIAEAITVDQPQTEYIHQ